MSDINFGPLEKLVGRWEGDKGMDVSPEKVGIEENPFYELITIEEGGDVSNAEAQTLAFVKYTRLVWRKSNNGLFHDQAGYFTWDEARGVISHCFIIPRSVAVNAGGTFAQANVGEETITLEFAASASEEDWTISQSPFMRDNAKTVAYSQKITVTDDLLIYNENTKLDIYGRSFDHTDSNRLVKQT